MDQEPAGSLLIRAKQAYDLVAGDPAGSRTEAELLVGEARTAGDVAALVAALRALAHAYRYLLAHDAAEPLVEEAIRLARRHRLDVMLGEALVTRGALRHEQGRTAAARRDLERAAQVLGPDGAAEVDLQRATLAHNAGRLGEAAGIYADMLGRPGLHPQVRVRAANNLGLVEATMGRHDDAAAWLERAATWAKQAGRAYEAMVAESRAWAAVRAGRLPEGMARFDEAVRLWQGAGLPLGELYAEYADALADLRLLPEAREQAERAAAMLDRQHVPLMAAEAHLRVAGLAAVAGDTEAAEELAEETARRLRRQRRPDWAARACLVAVEARLARGAPRRTDHALALRAARALEAAAPSAAGEAYLTAGRVAAATGRRRLALADWHRAAEHTRSAPVLVRLKGHVARALAAQAHGRDAEVLATCRAALDDLAHHRDALPSTELRALASGHGVELSRLGLATLARSRSPARVLAWMERTRAAALAAVEPDPEAVSEDDLGALRAVHAEIAETRREHGTAPAALLGRQAEIEARLRRRTWTGAARDAGGPAATGRLVQTGPRFSPAALRGALAGRVLVEYDVVAGRLLAAVVEPRRIRLVELGDAAPVEAEIAGLRMLLRALAAGAPQVGGALRDLAAAAVGRLADRLVAPLRLAESAGAVVVPVGELQRVPWSALLDRPVSVAPSAALWLRTAHAPAPAGDVLLAAGPDLPGAVEEVRVLAGHYPGARLLVPPDSRVEEVRADLETAALAHLACHGTVRADNPTFSCLHLADGQLTIHDLERHAGAPHRLVLAACDVGSSVTYPGNEVLGFVGTLLTRGTAGLVACTVLVPDRHVTELMLALHDGVRDGATMAEAVHAARASIDPTDATAYPAWCAFTAYGAA